MTLQTIQSLDNGLHFCYIRLGRRVLGNYLRIQNRINGKSSNGTAKGVSLERVTM